MSARWVVLKLGGTSVASVEGWRSLEPAVCSALAQGERVLVVCSALASVSNTIDSAIARSERGEGARAEVEALCRQHQSLAHALGIALPAAVMAALGDLEAGLSAIEAAKRADPPTRARLMALGEHMSSQIGTIWLRARGHIARWVDARDLLAADGAETSEARRFLQAEVVPACDPQHLASLEAGEPVLVTQGFIARGKHGETVLLGRGGSDTSASVLGVLFRASRVEIWTDVPGLFTGDPAHLSSARPLPELGYDEAEAMASLGAKVLHPRSVAPLRAASIPLHVRSTYRRDLPGTFISKNTPIGAKAVTSRSGLYLLKMSRPVRWQPIGFLAEVSACFQQHGLSIDMLSSSPGLITATIDPLSAPQEEIDGLLDDLGTVCAVDLSGRAASVSIVGSRLRSDMARLGSALAVADGFLVHALLQGASDHHLTLVVDEASRAPLAARLHAALFEGRESSGVAA